MTTFSTENLNESELTAGQIYIQCMRCPTAVPLESGLETSGLKATRHTSIPSFPCATRHPLLKEAVNAGFGDVQSKRAVLLLQTPRRQGLGRFNPLQTTKMGSEPTLFRKSISGACTVSDSETCISPAEAPTVLVLSHFQRHFWSWGTPPLFIKCVNTRLKYSFQLKNVHFKTRAGREMQSVPPFTCWERPSQSQFCLSRFIYWRIR